MARWMKRILLCLFLGVIVNIAIAWACAWLSVPRYGGFGLVERESVGAAATRLQDAGEMVVAGVWRSFGHVETDYYKLEGWLREDRDPNVNEFLDPYVENFKGTVEGEDRIRGVMTNLFRRRGRRVDSGWPMPAMRGVIVEHETEWDTQVLAGIRVMRPWTGSYGGLLPTVPLWTGFLVNSGFYALCVAGIGVIAHWRRRRRALASRGFEPPPPLAGRRRRTLLAAALCLVLGCVVTIAVAWSIAWFLTPVRSDGYNRSITQSINGESRQLSRSAVSGVSRFSFGSVRQDRTRERRDRARERQDRGRERREEWRMTRQTFPSFEDYYPAWARTIARADEFGRWPGNQHLIVEGLGWPMLAMSCEYEPDPDVPRQRRARSGIGTSIPRKREPGSGFSGLKTLPLRPIWSGFLFNATFFALVFGVLLFGPFKIRHSLRTRRGACLACGYALQGAYAAGCPECGWNRPVSRVEHWTAPSS